MTNYINYLENKFDSKYDIELAEYYRDQYQYLTSLSLKEQLEILVDRFEWFLHEPTILLLDRILYKDPTRNPYMMGNFAPVESENDAYLLTDITGKVPTDINGVYLRNGPNPLYIPSNGLQHWFDGDSMVHAIRIKDGTLQYCNKYTLTDKLIREM